MMDERQKDFYQKLRGDISAWLETKIGKENVWGEYILAAPDLFHLLCKLAVDPEVPDFKKIKLAAVLVYFISPLDFLPELFLGPIGYLDDISLTAYVLNELVLDVDPKIVRQHWAGKQDILELIKTILANADKMVGSGIWKKILGKFKK
jgi:uncharacterized membrane protein YkvA (DUF1232 family)